MREGLPHHFRRVLRVISCGFPHHFITPLFKNIGVVPTVIFFSSITTLHLNHFPTDKMPPKRNKNTSEEIRCSVPSCNKLFKCAKPRKKLLEHYLKIIRTNFILLAASRVEIGGATLLPLPTTIGNYSFVNSYLHAEAHKKLKQETKRRMYIILVTCWMLT